MKFLQFLRAVFVSPEFLVCILIYGTYLYAPAVFAHIGSRIRGDLEVIKYLVLIAPATLVWIMMYCRDVLHQPKETNNLFLNWPDYAILKIRVFAAIAIAVACSLLAIGIWIYSKDLGHAEYAAILIGLILCSLIDAFSIWLATQSIKEIIEREIDPNTKA